MKGFVHMKRILYLSMAVLILCGCLRFEFNAQAQENKIENKYLSVEFDETSGNAEVTDKRTGQKWTQQYMIPSENTTLFEMDMEQILEGKGSVGIDGAKVVKKDNVKFV